MKSLTTKAVQWLKQPSKRITKATHFTLVDNVLTKKSGYSYIKAVWI